MELEQRFNAMLTRNALNYLRAVWVERNGTVTQPKAGPILRDALEAALRGDVQVAEVDFEASRRDPVRVSVSDESFAAITTAAAALGTSLSSYAAFALDAYMKQNPLKNPISDDILEPKPTHSSPSDTQSLREELAQTKAQLATANETIAHLVEMLHNATRNTPSPQQTLEGA